MFSLWNDIEASFYLKGFTYEKRYSVFNGFNLKIYRRFLYLLQGEGDWPSSPDEFLESLFSMDDTLIPDLDDEEQIKQITTSLMEGDDRISSYSDEPDFPGFDIKPDLDGNNGLLPLSSAASDSGLSSDHLDL